HRDFPDRASFEGELLRHLAGKGVELVVLAGFLRLLSPRFIDAFPGRIINVHPSLLPAFPGLHAPRQALRHGVRYTGCTVHFVDEGCDTGPIILQAPVPVVAGDDEASLAARIRKAEHRLLPEAIRLFIEGRLVVEGRRVRILAEGKGRGNTEKRRESA
ncbi:MAG: phosphoribosylglycinamide formyltransferase, partial [Deltaproteobacteria bacterium]